MSFGNKDNGREYINRTNSNSNKMQSLNNRNLNSSQQYSNSNNGDSYNYEMKNQRICNSPKQGGDIHNPQQNNIREHYPYKNDNVRARHFQNKYVNDRSNYYNQQSNSPVDIIIPDIDQLREFIREQSEQFKFELTKYEHRKSSSPSPRSNFHQDQVQQRPQQRPPGSQNRPMSGMSTSTSLGAITSNSNFTVPSFASTATNNLVKPNYNKTVQQSTKPNNLLTRNISHDETFCKVQAMNKNRVGSPNNILDKPIGSKSQYAASNVGPIRQDSKSDVNKSMKYNQYSFSTGMNSVTCQQNTNNAVTSASYANEIRKINPLPRSNMGPLVSNGKNVGTSGYECHKNPSRLNGEPEPVKTHRVEVRIVDTINSRHLSNSGNIGDSQDLSDFCTPDSPVSLNNQRSSQLDDNRAGFGQTRPPNKKP